MKTFEIEKNEAKIIEQFELLSESQCKHYKKQNQFAEWLEDHAERIKSGPLYC